MKEINNRLITIPISHYCEKARWALEWSNIRYIEERHLQGFHYLYSYIAAKSRSVPVFITSNRTLTDSTDIVKWCDTLAPEDRKLRPIDLPLQKEVDDLEDYFDEHLGVAGRSWMYSYLLNELPLLLKYSCAHDVPKHELWLMPKIFSLVKSRIRNAVKMTASSKMETKATICRIFDEVAKKLENRKFLVAESFTSADLTFAALSASVLLPENYGVKLPNLEELPQDMQEQIRLWRLHPAGQFALRLYKEFRNR